jgi:hypothetical protein
VLAGVARALVRLHGLGIVHRDLKVFAALAHTGSPPSERAAFAPDGWSLPGGCRALLPPSSFPCACLGPAGSQRARRCREPRASNRLWPGMPHHAGPRAARSPVRTANRSPPLQAPGGADAPGHQTSALSCAIPPFLGGGSARDGLCARGLSRACAVVAALADAHTPLRALKPRPASLIRLHTPACPR